VKISCSTRLRESTIKNLRELLKNQINQQTNLIMFSHSPIEERFKEFRNRFSQTFDADSSKLSSAESFISEDDELFAETVILSVSIEN